MAKDLSLNTRNTKVLRDMQNRIVLVTEEGMITVSTDLLTNILSFCEPKDAPVSKVSNKRKMRIPVKDRETNNPIDKLSVADQAALTGKILALTKKGKNVEDIISAIGIDGRFSTDFIRNVRVAEISRLQLVGYDDERVAKAMGLNLKFVRKYWDDAKKLTSQLYKKNDPGTPSPDLVLSSN